MTRVRIIWQEGPGEVSYAGPTALRRIAQLVKGNPYTPIPAAPTRWQWAVQAISALQKVGLDYGKLIVYREPRRIRAKNSRYKQALRTIYGGLNGMRMTPPVRGGQRRDRPAQPRKPARASRTVKMLEQELLAPEDAF